MGIEIKSGIPIPLETVPRRPQRATYVDRGEMKRAICSLEPGQSFTYPRDRRQSLYNAATDYGINITVRAVSDDFVRVWRIE